MERSIDVQLIQIIIACQPISCELHQVTSTSGDLPISHILKGTKLAVPSGQSALKEIWLRGPQRTPDLELPFTGYFIFLRL